MNPGLFPSSKADSEHSLLHFVFADDPRGSNRNYTPGSMKWEGKDTFKLTVLSFSVGNQLLHLMKVSLGLHIHVHIDVYIQGES